MSEQIDREESLVCEALVREIGSADRWSAILEAWSSLMYVRKMAANLRSEHKHLFPSGASKSGGSSGMVCEGTAKGAFR